MSEAGLPEGGVPASPAGARFALVHDGLLALLVALRPLVWDEDPTQPYACCYLVLIALALAVLAAEALAGARDSWRWSGRGLLLAGLVAWFAFEAWRSPLPLQGWELWSSQAGDLALAWYLMQVMPGRERLALAALGAGALTELALAQLQWCWVLPAMARAQAAGHLPVPAGMAGLVAERIANGGVYGTFTQANALAGYCLVALPPLAVAAWNGGRRARVALVCLLPLALSVMILTSSKAAYLALATAVLAVWWWRRWRWRLATTLGLAALLALALALPGPAATHLREKIGDGLWASAEVRIGYWQAALGLLHQHPLLGVGLRGYTAAATAQLPVWAGYSTHAHSEPLEAACEGGLAAGAALLLLLAWLPWRGPAAPTAPSPLPRPLPAALAAGLGVLYASFLGLLTTNTGWWPGAQQLVGGLPLVEMAYWVAVAGFLAAALTVLRALPPPPPWSCALALLALGLHVLVDFDLHAGGVAGTAAVVAVLAGSPVRSLSASAAPAWRSLAPTLLAALAVLLVAGWIVAAGRQREASEIELEGEALRGSARGSADRQQLLEALAGHLDAAPAPDARPAAVLGAALDRAEALAPWDYPLRVQLLALRRPGPEREARTAALAQLYPLSATLEKLWAQDERIQAASDRDAGGHHRDEVLHLRRAEALDPYDLRLKQALAEALTRAAAAAATPSERSTLTAEAAAETARIGALAGQVDWTNR